MDALVSAALAVFQDSLALGHETFHGRLGRFIRDRSHPRIEDANHVDSVTASAPGDIDALLAEAAEEYQHVESLRWDIDARTPPEFEARLQFEGYESREDLLFILEGDLRGQSPEADVRLVDDEHGWAAFGSLHAIDWARDNGADGAPDPDDAAANFESLRSKSPPLSFGWPSSMTRQRDTFGPGLGTQASDWSRRYSSPLATVTAGWLLPSCIAASRIAGSVEEQAR